MELKTISPILAACKTVKTNLINLGNYVQVIPEKMMTDIAIQGIDVTGAQVWEYFGCDGNPEQEFTLKIAIPVLKSGKNTDNISFENLESYKCLTHTHKGPWSDFKDVYCTLIAELNQKGYKMNGYTREVYLHCDFEKQENCVTEIQIGIF